MPLEVKAYRRPIGNADELPTLEELEPREREPLPIYERVREWSVDVKKILWQLKRCCEEVSIDTDNDIRDLDDRIVDPVADAANEIFTNQVGGTNQDYDVVIGAIDGVNTVYRVAKGSYDVDTLSVFLNGHRQGEGDSLDWVPLDPDSGTFKMNTPPTSPDKIIVKYTEDVLASDADTDYIIESTLDTLTGAINGSNKVFTTSSAYLSGSLRVWQGVGGGGQLQTQGSSEDWTETSSTTFTMVTAPISGDEITVVYQSTGIAREQVDQSGGTNDTFGVLQGVRDGTNKKFVVSKGVYKTKTLLLENGGQAQTQGDSEDWEEGNPGVGMVEFITAPKATDQITAIYQVDGDLDHTHHDPGVDVDDDYTVRPVDTNIRVDATAGNKTITLPALSVGAGLEFNIGKVDASVNTVTVQGTGGETINGDATLVINFRNSVASIHGTFTEWLVA